ncbi:MAG: hypothetical protein U0903_08575 [Planctomycetales bacterium]
MRHGLENCLRLAACLIALSCLTSLPAAEKAIETALTHPILPPNTTQTETLNFARPRVPPFPEFKTKEAFQDYAAKKRQEILDNVIYRGVPDTWKQGPVKVEMLDTIPGGPGYKIRKLRYEALPGLWIPALLYLPDNLSGKVPVFLNVNGHDGDGKQAQYKQMRCINQAKRGIIALNVEWFGMGQLRSEGFAHGRLNQLDLCGVSGVSVFYLNMKRGLDLLLSLENADPTRVGVAGLSGGGWQTIFISSLDTRVTLTNPVAGYSSLATRLDTFADLGDSEQAPVDFSVYADYTHLTALLAPRHALLTYNSNDGCCFKSATALPPLLETAFPVYRLFNALPNFNIHVNDIPGDHNFQRENRESLYTVIGRHWFPGDGKYSPVEIPSENEVKTKEELNVPIPENNASFHSLALDAAKPLPANPAIPTDAAARATWSEERRKTLRDVIHYREFPVNAETVAVEMNGEIRIIHWKLRCAQDWSIPATEFSQGEPAETVILIGDEGRAKLAHEVEALLKQKKRVLAVDPWYFGENLAKERSYLHALVLSTLGERPLGLQASQLVAVARWSRTAFKDAPVQVSTFGPRTSLIGLMAAAVDAHAISSLELHKPRASLKEVLTEDLKFEKAPEQFTFGLLKEFDVPQLQALVLPRAVSTK